MLQVDAKIRVLCLLIISQKINPNSIQQKKQNRHWKLLSQFNLVYIISVSLRVILILSFLFRHLNPMWSPFPVPRPCWTTGFYSYCSPVCSVMHTTQFSFQVHASYKRLGLAVHLLFSIFRNAVFNSPVWNLVGQTNAEKSSEDEVVLMLCTKSVVHRRIWRAEEWLVGTNVSVFCTTDIALRWVVLANRHPIWRNVDHKLKDIFPSDSLNDVCYRLWPKRAYCHDCRFYVCVSVNLVQ